MRSLTRVLGRRGKSSRRHRRLWLSNRRVAVALERLEDRTLLSAGALDPTFGVGGLVTTDLVGSAVDSAADVAVQADGSIVVVGRTEATDGNVDFALARYNSDGTLDTTFGADGLVTTDFGGTFDRASSVTIDGNGRIVVAGLAGTDFALVRYNIDGSLDTGFGIGGRVTTDFGTNIDIAEGVAIDGSGRIVAAGRAGDDFAVARYNGDGSLDATFDGDGKVTTDFAGTSDFGFAVAVDAGDRIVVAGTSFLTSRDSSIPKRFALVRYNADGSLDTGFDGDGKVTTDVVPTSSLDEVAYSVLVDSDGRILAGGQAAGDFALVRYNSDGSLDTSFDGDGIVVTPVSGIDLNEGVRDLVIDSAGRIIAVGGAAGDFAIFRYNGDGTLNAEFDGDGQLATDFGRRFDVGHGVALTSEGRIVAAGFSGDGVGSGRFPSDFAVSVYTPDGTLDTSFGTDGRAVTDFPTPGRNRGYDLLIQPDGRILIVGDTTDADSRTDFALARYNSDGTVDTTFGIGGRVVTDFGGGFDQANAVAIDSLGRIVVAGHAQDAPFSDQDFALARYNPDGTLDTTFGTNGRVLTDIFGDDDIASAVAVDAAGRIVVAGEADESTSFDIRFALARYNTDGSLDSSFGFGGIVTTDLSTSRDVAFDVAIDAVGRIVAAGIAADFDFALVRYNADGNLDTGFGTGGTVITDFAGNRDFALGVAIDSSDRIIAAGHSRQGATTGQDFALARYNSDGSLDASFGTGGKVTTDFGGTEDAGRDVTIDRAGRIVVAGQSFQDSWDFALARYNTDGALDISFGSGGKVLTSFGGGTDSVAGVGVDASGRIVAGGQAQHPETGADFAVARYLASTAPVAEDDSYATDEDAVLSVAAPGVLGNDSDVDGDTLTAILVSGPTNGALTLEADGSFTYTPNPNFNGSDSFTYKTNDGSADSNTATVTITVAAVNDAPVAVDDAYTTDEDIALSVGAPGMLANDTDVEGSVLKALVDYMPIHGPKNGTLNYNVDGSFIYVPNANFHGTDSFTYKANDGELDSNTATVTITVNAVNDAPVAAGDSYSTDEDAALTIAAPGVLGNDSDVEDDSLTAVLVTGPSNGLLTLNTDGSFTYTPAADFHGTDTFTYKANDGQADSNVATVTITVNAVNDAPVAEDDAATTDEDTAVTIDVRANDGDVDGDSLSVTAVTQGLSGTVVINADQTVTYTPAADFNGTDSFTYTIDDGNGGTATATVSITVDPVNDAPTGLVLDNESIPENTDTSSALTVGTLSAFDPDAEDSLTFALVPGTGDADNASFQISGNKLQVVAGTVLDFEAKSSYSVRVQVSDGTLAHEKAFTIRVTDVNEAPVVSDAAFRLDENSPNGTLVGQLSGRDPDAGQTPIYSILSGNESGAFAIDAATGAITVAHYAQLDYEVTPSFTLTVQAQDSVDPALVATAEIAIDLNDLAEIDIDPGDDGNTINLKRDSRIAVAILSTSSFDATTDTNVGSLNFSIAGVDQPLQFHRKHGPRTAIEDVNGDGLSDLIVYFELDTTGLEPGTATAVLRGLRLDGTVFVANGSVLLEGGNGGGKGNGKGNKSDTTVAVSSAETIVTPGSGSWVDWSWLALETEVVSGNSRFRGRSLAAALDAFFAQSVHDEDLWLNML